MASFDVEIVFSGGIVLVIGADEDRPRNPQSVEALLVDVPEHDHTHGNHVIRIPRHAPILSYRANDHRSRKSDTPLTNAPDGHQQIQVDLSQKTLEIIPGASYATTEFTMDWAEKDASGKYPRAPSEVSSDPSWEFMDWIPDGQQAGLETVDRDLAIASIVLPPGNFSSRTVLRNRAHPYKTLLWGFDDDQDGRAVADQIVLRLEGLEEPLQLKLSGEQYPIRLNPLPDELLRLSITNLPEKVPARTGVAHFKMYSRIAHHTHDVASLNLIGAAQTPNSWCPPIKYNES